MTSSTERVRLCRMRAYRGQLILQSVRVADGIALVDWLEGAGYLPTRVDHSKAEICEAAGRYLSDATRYIEPNP